MSNLLDRSSWVEQINSPGEIEVVSTSVIIPKVIYDRIAVNVKGEKLDVNKFIIRFLMNKHGLVSKREKNLLESWLDLNKVKKVFNKYSKNKIDIDTAILELSRIE